MKKKRKIVSLGRGISLDKIEIFLYTIGMKINITKSEREALV